MLFVSSTSASIASRPAFVTIASRPSWWDGTARLVEVIWVGAERNYFCNRDWTPQITLIRFNKSAFCENVSNVLSCPHDVATRSDSDALFEGAVEALGEFGKAEILDRPKTLAA